MAMYFSLMHLLNIVLIKKTNKQQKKTGVGGENHLLHVDACLLEGV